MALEVDIIADAADDTAAIRLALDYPYARHPEAYWFQDRAIGRAPDPVTARAGRIPVVAYGSNAAPLQIARKFAGRDCGDALYVEPVTLHGWDVIYAARITRYGAIPARLMAHAGCAAAVHVTWLTGAQLDWMDATEGGNYIRARMQDDSVIDAAGAPIAAAEAYLEGGEALSVDGQHAALDAISANGRGLPGHRTEALLTRLAQACDHAGAVEAFALRLVREPGYATEVLPLLRRGL